VAAKCSYYNRSVLVAVLVVLVAVKCSYWCQIMERIMQVVAEHVGRLRKTQWVPRFSYGRGMLRKDGAPNKNVLTCLFGDMELAVQFLKDVGIIRSMCNITSADEK
jgi:hypothetical protein